MRDVPISRAALVDFKKTLGEKSEAKLQRLDEQSYTNVDALCKGTSFTGEECLCRV